MIDGLDGDLSTKTRGWSVVEIVNHEMEPMELDWVDLDGYMKLY